VKEVGKASNAAPLARRRRGKPPDVGMRRDTSHLQRTDFSTSRPDQRPGVLIVGFCRGEVFVADELLIHAETRDAEEAVHAWLAQHGIRMSPTDKVSTSQSARDAIGSNSSGPAKARHDGGNDQC
jgi:hypothetical protein